MIFFSLTKNDICIYVCVYMQRYTRTWVLPLVKDGEKLGNQKE